MTALRNHGHTKGGSMAALCVWNETAGPIRFAQGKLFDSPSLLSGSLRMTALRNHGHTKGGSMAARCVGLISPTLR
jgi:hypothetical protein